MQFFIFKFFVVFGFIQITKPVCFCNQLKEFQCLLWAEELQACYWDGFSCKQTSCANFKNKEICELFYNDCYWSESCRQIPDSCNDYFIINYQNITNSLKMNLSNQCQVYKCDFSSVSQTCVNIPFCTDLLMQSTTCNQEICEFESGGCKQPRCMHFHIDACIVSDFCIWKGNSCKTKICLDFSKNECNEKQVEYSKICQYNDGSQKCEALPFDSQCQLFITQSICTINNKCKWNNNKCLPKDCSDIPINICGYPKYYEFESGKKVCSIQNTSNIEVCTEIKNHVFDEDTCSTYNDFKYTIQSTINFTSGFPFEECKQCLFERPPLLQYDPVFTRESCGCEDLSEFECKDTEGICIWRNQQCEWSEIKKKVDGIIVEFTEYQCNLAPYKYYWGGKNLKCQKKSNSCYEYQFDKMTIERCLSIGCTYNFNGYNCIACSSSNDKNDCENNLKCSWENNQCVFDQCVQFYEKTCYQLANCYYDSEVKLCKRVICSKLMADNCNQKIDQKNKLICNRINNTCEGISELAECYFFNTQDSCQLTKNRCRWNISCIDNECAYIKGCDNVPRFYLLGKNEIICQLINGICQQKSLEDYYSGENYNCAKNNNFMYSWTDLRCKQCHPEKETRLVIKSHSCQCNDYQQEECNQVKLIFGICYWDILQSKCLLMPCSNLTTYQCSNVPEKCYWTGSNKGCQPKSICSQLIFDEIHEELCEKQGCQFNYIEKKCSEKLPCKNILKEKDCILNKCFWSDSLCQNYDCESLKNQSRCLENSECKWKDNLCQLKNCSDRIDESCQSKQINNEVCIYSYQLNRCVGVPISASCCSYNQRGFCLEQDERCYWDNQKCRNKNCQDLRSHECTQMKLTVLNLFKKTCSANLESCFEDSFLNLRIDTCAQSTNFEYAWDNKSQICQPCAGIIREDQIDNGKLKITIEDISKILICESFLLQLLILTVF